jgi:hypothetical protein
MPVYKTLIIFIAFTCLAMVTACSTPKRRGDMQAPINHVVLIDLEDPADTQELLDDCQKYLAPIPSVITYWAGYPLDIGRGEAVDGNYDVGLCVGFTDVEGLREYGSDPGHVLLVDKWKNRWIKARIFDVSRP